MPDDRTPSSSLGVGTTRWASGGVINPSDPTPGASGRGVGSGAPSDGSRGWSAGAIPRAARGGLASSSTSAPRVDPTNVGFRMLRKAGWNVGEGLGKDKQGDTEPLRVWKKHPGEASAPSAEPPATSWARFRRRKETPHLTPDDPSRALARRTTTSRPSNPATRRRRGWRDRRATGASPLTSVARFARRRPARTRIRFSEDDASAKRRRHAARNPAVSEGARGTTSAAACRRIIPFGVCSDAAPRLVGCEIESRT